VQRRPGCRGLWTLYNNTSLFLFTQSLSLSGSIQFEFEIFGNIQRELLKQHQATWRYSWSKLIHFRRMVKLDGFIKNEHSFLKKPQARKHVSDALSTLMCSQKYAFLLSSKTHRSKIRVHTTVLMHFKLPTLKRSKRSWTSMRMLQTQKALIFLGIVFILMRFRPFSTRTWRGGGGGGWFYLGWYNSWAFSFGGLSRAFSNRCVLDENAQRISLDGTPKRMCGRSLNNLFSNNEGT